MQIHEIDCITGIEITRNATSKEVSQAKKDAKAAKEQDWVALRAERDARLAASDWTQLPDAPADAKWKAYRQRLRDLPEKTKDPAKPSWPKPPSLT